MNLLFTVQKTGLFGKSILFYPQNARIFLKKNTACDKISFIFGQIVRQKTKESKVKYYETGMEKEFKGY